MMSRRYVLLAPLLLSSPTMAADEDHDFTCVDSGTRYRVVVFRDVPGQDLPCTIQTYEHPLGLYSMKWTIPWIVKNQTGFCEAKTAEIVDERRRAGWKCMLTKKWRGG